jgi:hypothetical protein
MLDRNFESIPVRPAAREAEISAPSATCFSIVFGKADPLSPAPVELVLVNTLANECGASAK